MSTLSFDTLKELLQKRRSIRYFSEKKIEKKILDDLIEVAEMSPSVENTKPWHFTVIQSQEVKSEIMKASCYGNFITGASAVIIVTCDRATQKRASEPMWNIKEMEYSCAIAMENIMLAALTMDIGSCFISLHHGPIHNLLHLNESTIVIGGVMLGYIKDEELLTNKKHDLRSPQEIATYLD